MSDWALKTLEWVEEEYPWVYKTLFFADASEQLLWNAGGILIQFSKDYELDASVYVDYNDMNIILLTQADVLGICGEGDWNFIYKFKIANLYTNALKCSYTITVDGKQYLSPMDYTMIPFDKTTFHTILYENIRQVKRAIALSKEIDKAIEDL